MTLNHELVGTVFDPVATTWSKKDCMVYALGVGAGTEDLQFTTENSEGIPLRMLPSMPVVLARTPGNLFKTVGLKLQGLVHGSQSFSILKEPPVEGTLHSTTTLSAIYDKGSSGVVVLDIDSVLEGETSSLFRTQIVLVARGQGGWGGDRGPSALVDDVDWSTAEAVEYQTRPDQALLYRLSGDRNPLHSDPTFAKKAGFDQPILHGLCTFGFVSRAILATLGGGEPGRISSFSARFASPVYPGEALRTEIVAVESGRAAVRALVGDRVVLDQGLCTYASSL